MQFHSERDTTGTTQRVSTAISYRIELVRRSSWLVRGVGGAVTTFSGRRAMVFDARTMPPAALLKFRTDFDFYFQLIDTFRGWKKGLGGQNGPRDVNMYE